ncbi:MDR family MFS transporter [Nesterenkonia populi]
MTSSSPRFAETGRSRLRDLPGPFWWLWLARLIIMVGHFVVPFMTIFLTSQVGLTAGSAGMVVAAFGVGVVVSGLVGGVLADRIGRKVTLVGSQLLSVVVLVFIPAAQDQLVISGLLALYGLFNGCSYPVIATMIGDLVEPAHRRLAFNYNYWAVNLGYAIGPLMAGFMADTRFELIFYGQALMLTASMAVVVVKVPDSDAAGAVRAPAAAGKGLRRRLGKPDKGGLRQVLRDRTFVTFGLVMLIYSIVYVQSTTTLPLVMADQGFPSSAYGMLLTLNGVLLCILQIPTARIFGRIPRNLCVALFILVTAAGVGLQAAATTLVVYFIAVAIWTLGEMGSHPQAQSLAADLAEPARRGRYQGIFSMHKSLAMVIGPVLGGFVLEAFGASVLWLGAAGLCVVAAGLLMLTAPSRQRRVEENVAAETIQRRDAEHRAAEQRSVKKNEEESV